MNRRLRQSLIALGAAAVVGVGTASGAGAGTYDLSVDRVAIDTGDFRRDGIGFNGASPGPVLRFTEGEEVTINVTNNLDMESGMFRKVIVEGDPDGSYHPMQHDLRS